MTSQGYSRDRKSLARDRESYPATAFAALRRDIMEIHTNRAITENIKILT